MNDSAPFWRHYCDMHAGTINYLRKGWNPPPMDA
jgi:hypothetical protein